MGKLPLDACASLARYLACQASRRTVRLHLTGAAVSPITQDSYNSSVERTGMPMTEASGRNAASPVAIPARGWWAVLKRTYAEAGRDNLGLIAAGVAFYGFLALVPLLGSLVLAYGLFVDPHDVARHMQAVTAMVPTDAAKLIDDQLSAVVTTAASKKGFGLVVALLLALYGAMKGAGAIVTALNVAYEQPEDRGFVKTTLVNAAVTVGAVLIAIAALMAISATGFAEDIATRISPVAATAIKIASWVVAAVLASAAVAALYRYAPARAPAKWRWLTTGSIVATVGWAIMTVGFGWYATNFGNYNATYGALGSVVVLLMWLYLSAYILLLGAELNAELEHQTEVDSTTGPELPIGERKAAMADKVAD